MAAPRKPRSSKKEPKVTAVCRPLKPERWLSESEPDDIAAALVDIDAEHAMHVMVAIAMRLGPEAVERSRRLVEQAKQTPGQVALGAAVGALRNLMR